jgi:hypothetical protein
VLNKVQRKVDVPLLNANVTVLRFYSDDAQRTAYYNPQNRAYQTRFLKSQTAFIIWELVLEYPPPGRRIPYTIETNYYDAQGTFLSKQASSFNPL